VVGSRRWDVRKGPQSLFLPVECFGGLIEQLAQFVNVSSLAFHFQPDVSMVPSSQRRDGALPLLICFIVVSQANIPFQQGQVVFVGHSAVLNQSIPVIEPKNAPCVFSALSVPRG
jgi:hypothetical protein